MNRKTEDQLVEDLKAYAAAHGAEPTDHWIASLALTRSYRHGIDPRDPLVHAGILILYRNSLAEVVGSDNIDILIASIPKTGENAVRQELRSMSETDMRRFRNDILDLTKRGPATVKRGLKSMSDSIEAPPGHFPVLTTNQSIDLCNKILDLQKEGVDIGIAKKRAAKSFGISVATVNRIWRTRRKLFAN